MIFATAWLIFKWFYFLYDLELCLSVKHSQLRELIANM